MMENLNLVNWKPRVGIDVANSEGDSGKLAIWCRCMNWVIIKQGDEVVECGYCERKINVGGLIMVPA